jgi:hypothetical protein
VNDAKLAGEICKQSQGGERGVIDAYAVHDKALFPELRK